jgi:hypothetical protein
MTRNPTGGGDDLVAGIPNSERRHSLREKVAHEVRQFVAMFLYLFILFGLFAVHESIILEQHDINFTRYGFALVNALILAKVMLVAEDLHVGRRFEDYPLMYPVLFKSLMFATIFICFHVVENVIVGLWHGKTILESIPGFGGGGVKGLFSVAVLVSVALTPYFAFTELRRVLGAAALKTLMLKRGPK